MKNSQYVAISIVAVLVLGCVALTFSGYQRVLEDNPNFWQEIHAQQADPAYQAQKAQEEAESQALADKTFPYAVGVAVLFACLVFGGDIAKAYGQHLLIFIGGIVLLGAIAYFFGWSDKNGDGEQDVQIVRMIQPTGNDAENDKAYAEVNDKSADATMKNSLSLSIIWISFGIVVFIIGFVAQFFRREW